MSGLTDNPLVQGETVLYRVRLHPVIYLPTIKSLLLSTLIILAPYALKGVLSESISTLLQQYIGWIILSCVTYISWNLVTDIIKQLFTEIVVTDRRMAIKTGLFSTTTWELPLRQIESTSITRTFPGRIFNYGTVTIHGTGAGDSVVRFVKNPNDFTWHINDGQRRIEEQSKK